MLRKTLVTLLQSLHDMILSLYLKIHSFTQKFLKKWRPIRGPFELRGQGKK